MINFSYSGVQGKDKSVRVLNKIYCFSVTYVDSVIHILTYHAQWY